MILEWETAEEVMRKNIREIPKPKEQGPGEILLFDEGAFMSWIQEGSTDSPKFESPLKDDEAVYISDIEPDSVLRPKKGCVMKWEEGGDVVYCFRPSERASEVSLEVWNKDNGAGNVVRPEENIRGGGKGRGISWRTVGKIIAVAAAFVLIIAGVMGWNYYTLSKAYAAEKSKAEDNIKELKALEANFQQRKKKISKDKSSVKARIDKAKTFLFSAESVVSLDAILDDVKTLNRKVISDDAQLDKDKHRSDEKKKELLQIISPDNKIPLSKDEIAKLRRENEEAEAFIEEMKKSYA